MDLPGRLEKVRQNLINFRTGTFNATVLKTHSQLVLPFFLTLGFDPFDPTVVRMDLDLEPGLDLKAQDKSVMALAIDGQDVAIVLCLAYGCSLDSASLIQLKHICRMLQVRLGILTDGERYQLFDFPLPEAVKSALPEAALNAYSNLPASIYATQDVSALDAFSSSEPQVNELGALVSSPGTQSCLIASGSFAVDATAHPQASALALAAKTAAYKPSGKLSFLSLSLTQIPWGTQQAWTLPQFVGKLQRLQALSLPSVTIAPSAFALSDCIPWLDPDFSLVLQDVAQLNWQLPVSFWQMQELNAKRKASKATRTRSLKVRARHRPRQILVATYLYTRADFIPDRDFWMSRNPIAQQVSPTPLSTEQGSIAIPQALGLPHLSGTASTFVGMGAVASLFQNTPKFGIAKHLGLGVYLNAPDPERVWEVLPPPSMVYVEAYQCPEAWLNSSATQRADTKVNADDHAQAAAQVGTDVHIAAGLGDGALASSLGDELWDDGDFEDNLPDDAERFESLLQEAPSQAEMGSVPAINAEPSSQAQVAAESGQLAASELSREGDAQDFESRNWSIYRFTPVNSQDYQVCGYEVTPLSEPDQAAIADKKAESDVKSVAFALMPQTSRSHAVGAERDKVNPVAKVYTLSDVQANFGLQAQLYTQTQIESDQIAAYAAPVASVDSVNSVESAGAAGASLSQTTRPVAAAALEFSASLESKVQASSEVQASTDESSRLDLVCSTDASYKVDANLVSGALASVASVASRPGSDTESSVSAQSVAASTLATAVDSGAEAVAQFHVSADGAQILAAALSGAHTAASLEGTESVENTESESECLADAMVEPFLCFELLHLDQEVKELLGYLHKDHFDLDLLIEKSCSYMQIYQIYTGLLREYKHPSKEFVRIFVGPLLGDKKSFTTALYQQYLPKFKSALDKLILEQSQQLVAGLSRSAAKSGELTFNGLNSLESEGSLESRTDSSGMMADRGLRQGKELSEGTESLNVAASSGRVSLVKRAKPTLVKPPLNSVAPALNAGTLSARALLASARALAASELSDVADLSNLSEPLKEARSNGLSTLSEGAALATSAESGLAAAEGLGGLLGGESASSELKSIATHTISSEPILLDVQDTEASAQQILQLLEVEFQQRGIECNLHLRFYRDLTKICYNRASNIILRVRKDKLGIIIELPKLRNKVVVKRMFSQVLIHQAQDVLPFVDQLVRTAQAFDQHNVSLW